MAKPSVPDRKIQDEPIQVQGDAGRVAITAPDGSVVLLSPEAAEEISDRLWQWAMRARREQRRRGTPDQPGVGTSRPFIRWPESDDYDVAAGSHYLAMSAGLKTLIRESGPKNYPAANLVFDPATTGSHAS